MLVKVSVMSGIAITPSVLGEYVTKGTPSTTLDYVITSRLIAEGNSRLSACALLFTDARVPSHVYGQSLNDIGNSMIPAFEADVLSDGLVMGIASVTSLRFTIAASAAAQNLRSSIVMDMLWCSYGAPPVTYDALGGIAGELKVTLLDYSDFNSTDERPLNLPILNSSAIAARLTSDGRCL
jgi:hypothetical protein